MYCLENLRVYVEENPRGRIRQGREGARSTTGVFSEAWTPAKCGQASGGGEVQTDHWSFLHFHIFIFHISPGGSV